MAKTKARSTKVAEPKGYYVKSQRIKADATPIDDITKFAWDDDDYEDFDEFIEYTEEQLAAMDAKEKEEQESQKKEEQISKLIATAPERFDNIETTQSGITKEQDDIKIVQGDIMLMLADVFGGAQ